jgi:4'-phosphopantetheinyl transferase
VKGPSWITIGECIESGDDTVKALRNRGSHRVVRVHCVEVPLSLPHRTIERWIAALPDPRRSMLAQRLLRGHGLESLTVLALLASLTSVCRLPSLASLQWTPGGKPCFPDGPEFSLTHSRGFAACAVAPRGLRVGIDIEPADRARAASVALVAGDAERKALDAGALSPTELWTAKEAVLKAAGAGLSDICGVAVRNQGARYAGVHYGWRHFRPRNGLLLAVATRGRMPAVRIRWPSLASVFG